MRPQERGSFHATGDIVSSSDAITTQSGSPGLRRLVYGRVLTRIDILGKLFFPLNSP